MANGRLVKMLVHTDVTRYLDFKLIEGSYVFRAGSGIGKVPANGVEALKTGLVGFFQKRKLKSFLDWLAKFDPGVCALLNWQRFCCAPPSCLNAAKPSGLEGVATMAQLFDKYGLDKDSQEFIG